MTSTPNRFKAWLRGAGPDKPPGPSLGTWLMASAPATAEALGHTGFDFLVVDMEHVPIEMSDLAHILRAVGCTPAEPVVRLAWNDPVMVKRAMDAGARTLMLPFVQSAEEARLAAAAMRYPPEGTRGVAGIHRASRYGRDPDYLKRANDGVCTVVQLETPGAVERLPEVAAVPGVDAVFIGPSDIAAALGRIGEIAHPEVQGLLAKAAADARAAGKPAGIVGQNPEMAGRFVEYGYSFVAVSSDLGLMTGRAAEWLATLRGAPAPAPAAQAAY